MELLMDIRYALWGPFTVLFMVLTGVYMTWCSGGVQFWCVRALARQIRAPRAAREGGISPLQALFTSLGGTLGVGNLAGVAAAITLGGAGAVFYMLVAAFFGMATKFAEIVLAVRFRERRAGSPLGGPMVYLSKGAYHPFLAQVFCVCCLIASLGTGAMTQAGAIVEAVGAVAPVSPLTIGLVTAALAYPVLTGGSSLIAKTASVLVPVMTFLYLAGGALVLITYHDRILPALTLILTDALRPAAAGGGFLGVITARAVSDGFAKGVFSNEAGMGSAPIAHGCADSKSPCDQGILGAVEVFVDTCVVCLLTALVILVTGAQHSGATGLALTTQAFSSVFGGRAGLFICVTVCFLAFSTILGWSFYGLACLRYLTGGNRAQKAYLALITASVALAALFPLDTMLLAADVAAALMALPNLIGLWTLAPIVRHEALNYRKR